MNAVLCKETLLPFAFTEMPLFWLYFTLVSILYMKALPLRLQI